MAAGAGSFGIEGSGVSMCCDNHTCTFLMHKTLSLESYILLDSHSLGGVGSESVCYSEEAHGVFSSNMIPST